MCHFCPFLKILLFWELRRVNKIITLENVFDCQQRGREKSKVDFDKIMHFAEVTDVWQKVCDVFKRNLQCFRKKFIY